MERYLGFFWKGSQVVDSEQLENILADHVTFPYNNYKCFSHEQFSVGIAHVKNSIPKIRETDRYFFFASGRFDNVEFGQLFINDDLFFDAQFSKNLDSILDTIRGDFTFILYDKQVKNLVCARDHIGMKPFYYINRGEYFSFTNDIGTFRKIPNLYLRMDDQWIADSLALIRSAKNRTPYKNVNMLIPGHVLVIEDELKLTRYWSPNVKNDYSGLDFETASDIFSLKFENAVKRRLTGCNVIGSELSGGLDSSGVTAYAFKNRFSDKQPFYSLSHVLSKENRNEVSPFGDESLYSQSLVSSLNIKDHYLCSGTNSGILESIKRSIINMSAPSQATYHLFSDILLDKARQCGVEKLFSGFGGDEGVSSNANGFFHELILQKRRNQFHKEFQKYLARKGLGSFRSTLISEGYYHLEPFIDLFKGPKATRKQKFSLSALDMVDTQFRISMKIEARFIEKFVFPDEDRVRDRQINRVLQDYVTHRLESSYFTAKSYGIEYVYPLWDIDFLQFYLDLPIEYKYREGMGRAIYRESLKGYVPDEIRLRVDKTIRTIPSAILRIVNDYHEIEKLILRGKANNKFHYIDYKVLLNRLDSLRTYSSGKKGGAMTPGFVNAIQILLLQDMQHSGEFDSGIRQ